MDGSVVLDRIILGRMISGKGSGGRPDRHPFRSGVADSDLESNDFACPTWVRTARSGSSRWALFVARTQRGTSLARVFEAESFWAKS